MKSKEKDNKKEVAKKPRWIDEDIVWEPVNNNRNKTDKKATNNK